LIRNYRAIALHEDFPTRREKREGEAEENQQYLKYRTKEYRESGEKIEKFRNWRTGSY
jgi:hypothetical protein